MLNKHSFIFILLVGFIVSSCGTIQNAETVRTLDTGMASWYGPNFHGKLTANGETYNMNDLTAAHRSLPFNTVVKVTNLDNDRSVVVRVNDRGPYVGNRIIDLSRGAARKIDMEDAGVANVRIELVEEGDRPVTRASARSTEQFTVQLASYNSQREAKAASDKINGARVEAVRFGDRTVYRVYYGTYRSESDARSAQQRLSRNGHDGFVKQIEL
ncbi:MAG: septal ring lytic transglycosylase RlpA family protein [Balneolaceae bacterium]